MLAGLAEFEDGQCRDCGWHESLTSDKSNRFTFEIKHCPVCAGAEQFHRVLHDKDQKRLKALGDNPPARRKDSADGRKVLSRLMAPDE